MTQKLVIMRFSCISLGLECTQICSELFSIFGWIAANLAAAQAIATLKRTAPYYSARLRHQVHDGSCQRIINYIN